MKHPSRQTSWWVALLAWIWVASWVLLHLHGRRITGRPWRQAMFRLCSDSSRRERIYRQHILLTGRTSLYLAAQFGHESLVQYLLDAKAPIDQLTAHGDTPLAIALVQGHEPIVKLLLSHGANPQLFHKPAYPRCSTPLNMDVLPWLNFWFNTESVSIKPTMKGIRLYTLPPKMDNWR
ncbi:MAG: ankyrin repeat domain-containing protein [Phycisphaerales bacterium]|nr:ankyrin repeat domain-containing protein [Phycisphaerales bacterium]